MRRCHNLIPQRQSDKQEAQLDRHFSYSWGSLLKIHGGNKLQGAKVKALDLRAGIALLLAGMTAEGETEIENATQIGRGYENLHQKLRGLGVKI